MNKETVLQKFIQSITSNGLISINQTLIDLALKEDKQQIIDANDAGWKACNRRYNQNAEDYYQETFGDSNQAEI